jgi:transposase
MHQFDVTKHILTTTSTDREIGHTFGLSKNTVRRYRNILDAKQVVWLDVEHGGPTFLASLFQGPRSGGRRKVTPDLAALDQELRLPAMTLQLWWEKYRRADPDSALSYSHLAAKLAEYRAKLPTDMRQYYRPGEQVAVDYSGKLPSYIDAITGQPVAVQLFVGILSHSSLIFATCTPTQRVPDFLKAHVEMFAYFGGVPAMVVCDNLKSGVLKAGKTPVFQRSYLDLARHYTMLIRNTRPRRPRDKAPVESAVRIVQQRVLAQLHDQTFYSLDALNAAVRTLLDELNARPMQKDGRSRRHRFEALEQTALRPLPSTPYSYAEWFTVTKVPRDYHVKVLGHFYSVPHALIAARVDAKVEGDTVEIFHDRRSVVLHRLASGLGGHTTDPTHQPESHRVQANRSPEGMLAWAQSAGPNVIRFVRVQLERPQPYLGLPACDEVQRLSAKHGTALVDRMAGDALAMKSPKATTLRRLVARAAKDRQLAEESGGAKVTSTSRTAQRPSHVRGARAIVGVPNAQ